jgi:hypothetical protein
MKTRLSIIIINWNGKNWLKQCLSSILGQNLNEPFEVLLVDNGSVDGSVAYVHESFPKVKIIELDRNYGFAEGNNLAVRNAGGDYLIFVNNDTKAEEEWLKNLVQAADVHPEFQILCSIQLPSQKENRIVGLDVFGGGRVSQFESFSAITDSIFANGGCFLIRRKWIENLGYLFDSHYFCYAEDVELSLRTIMMGGRIGYVRDSRIQHYKSGSAPPSFPRMYLNTRNLLLTYYKLFTPNGFRRFFLARSILYSVNSMYAFMVFPKKWRKNIKIVSGVVGGICGFLQDFGRYRDFREEFLKHRLREDEYIFRRLFTNGRLEKLCKKMILGAP